MCMGHDKNIPSCELESAFTETFNLKKTNIVTGCIFKYLNVSLNKFNEFYLNDLLDKLSKENKDVFHPWTLQHKPKL